MTENAGREAATDRELLRRADREPGAFRAVYDRHATRIHGFHFRRTRDPGWRSS